MIKRFCDRCGSETFVQYTRIKEKKINTEFWVEKFGRDTIVHTPADLCENCIKSFRNWWIAYKRDELFKNDRPLDTSERGVGGSVKNSITQDDSPIGGFHDD